MDIRRNFRLIMLRFFGAKGFSKILVNAGKSKTYGLFCEKVYGRNLSQFNMVDEEQLQKLLSVLNLNSSHSVLDLGCGIGTIAEYISDTTGAKVTGIDFAYGAIAEAKNRTQKKSDRLKFAVGNLNSLPVDLGKFDFILAIDTLYFVDDLNKTIQSISRLLNPGGQFSTFYTSRKVANSSAQVEADSTRVAVALGAAKLRYRYWDFTNNEQTIWNLTSIAAEEFKEDFLA